MKTGNRRLLTWALVVAALAPAAGMAAPTVKMLAETCAQCHGTDGKSVGSIEKLYGASALEIEEDMRESKYQDKGRIMAPIAKAYTDEQIREIARYFATLPKRK